MPLAAAYDTPGVYFERLDQAGTAILGVRTDIAGFVGIAERGPLDAPTKVESWRQFRDVFGDCIPSGHLAYAARGFFSNGGARCYVVRSAGPDNATAAGDVLGVDGATTLSLSASSPGSWGNRLAIRVGSSSPGATATSPGGQPADRGGLFVRSVVGLDRFATVRLTQPQPSGLVESFRVATSVDATRALVSLDLPLDLAFDLNSQVFVEVVEFYLSVYEVGDLAQVMPRLSMILEHPRYVGRVLEEMPAPLIAIADPESLSVKLNRAPSLSLPARLPSLTAVNLIAGRLVLTGGVDGITSILPVDLTGDRAAPVKAGLRTLEDVEEVAVVAIPDATIRPGPLPVFQPQPPTPYDPCLDEEPPLSAPPPPAPEYEQAPDFSLDQVFHIQQALVAHCESQANRIALLDAPVGHWRGGGDEVGEVQAWRDRFDSKYAALYFPWLVLTDPIHPRGRLVRAVPPSGHVAGLYARTDFEAGPHLAPANRHLNWVHALTTGIGDELQGVLNPQGINCVRSLPGRGIRVYGARTVSSDPDWRFVNVRRLMMMIERAVLESVQWSVFEPNNVFTRQLLVVSISSFLDGLWRRGALVGDTGAQAYYVKCDEGNNPSVIADLGELLVEVGVAAVRPAEFVVFRIGRTQDGLEAVE